MCLIIWTQSVWWFCSSLVIHIYLSVKTWKWRQWRYLSLKERISEQCRSGKILCKETAKDEDAFIFISSDRGKGVNKAQVNLSVFSSGLLCVFEDNQFQQR